MKSPYINDLKPNQPATGTFLVHAKDVRQKKSGDLYLSLLLGDRTGEVDAKMWDGIAEVVETFDRDDFVRVRGLLNIYQNRPQFTIHKLQRVGEEEVDLSDFFPVSAQDLEAMRAELATVIAGIGNPHLRSLLEEVFGDEQVARLYNRAPAAKSVHHAYIGGLLEHVLSLTKLCRLAAGHYQDIDLDLLLAGALLHDVGKIHELTYERSFGYTTEGQLLGHITIGIRMIEEKLRALPDFPPRLRDLVEHMVLSHHGQLEFGSPKVPLFAEAVLLHHLDDMDSKMECVRSLLAQDRQVGGDWTGYSQQLDRAILKKERYLNGEPPAIPPPEPPKPSTPFGEKLLGALKPEGA
ncbi:MAG TPA: HD domain-containing protein [Bryobacteraceae bacterium]|nr:HD domain-containing protein [Bryobacteraceae bacterium]